jgi:TatD DNase family protein
MRLVDVHAHLHMSHFAGDLPDVIERAARAGVERIVCPGIDLASSRRCVELARSFSGCIHAAVGIHPNHSAEAGPDDLRRIEELAALPEVVAIGETGLDLYRRTAEPAEQARAFREHARIALAVGKPLIVHARKADEETLRILAEAGAALRAVRHYFDGSPAWAERYVEAGLHLSVGGAVTREGYRKLKQAVGAIPADRLLLETDCPYQTPASKAGGRNEPAFIAETLEAVAGLRGESPPAVAAATTANAEALFFAGG